MQDIISRLRAKKDDEGFTLIELLVVVVIIGVLVAIAVPVYLNYREGAADKSAQSDVRGAISAIEQYYTDNGNTYPTGPSGTQQHGELQPDARLGRQRRPGRRCPRRPSCTTSLPRLVPAPTRSAPRTSAAAASSTSTTAPPAARSPRPPSTTSRPAWAAATCVSIPARPRRDRHAAARCCSASPASSVSPSARSSTWSSTGCRAASRLSGRVRTARTAVPRSGTGTTSRCSAGCCCAAGAPTARRRSAPGIHSSRRAPRCCSWPSPPDFGSPGSCRRTSTWPASRSPSPPIDLDVHRLPDAIVLPSYGVALGLLLPGRRWSPRTGGPRAPRPARRRRALALYFGPRDRPPRDGFRRRQARPAARALPGLAGLELGARSAPSPVSCSAASSARSCSPPRRAGRRTAIPFGPYMLAGAVLAVFAAAPVADWYPSLPFSPPDRHA